MVVPETDVVTLATGARVAYTDTGEGRLAVILAHGFMLDRSMFGSQVESLRGDYRMITWDARGHGDTTDGEEPFTEWDNVADMLALLDHLGLERAVIGGMSQGGYLSMAAALREPERFLGIILIDTTAHGQADGVLEELASFGDAWAQDGPTDELCQLLGGMVFGSEGLEPWIAKWRQQPAERFANSFRAVMERDDLFDRLKQIPEIPTLVIHGSESVISIEEAQGMAAEIRGGRAVVVVEGAPHACNCTHPEQVNQAIRDFLEGL